MQVTDLRCDDKTDPLGIDISAPRLCWRLDAGDPTRRGLRQTAYQIVAGTAVGKSDLWDTGKVASDQSLYISYEGATVGTGQRVCWQVTVWDENDTPTTSETAFWEMGLLSLADWQGAEWIQSGLAGGPRTTVPVPTLRRGFAVPEGVTDARLYVTALGLYEASINGKRVGDEWLTPGWTNYHKAVHYQTYDVTQLLTPGENRLDVALGDGWYCGHVGGGARQEYGDRPRLLLMLVARDQNGAETVVVSNGDWQYAFGYSLESDMMQGESADARQTLGPWYPVETFADPGIERRVSHAPPIRIIEEVAPVGPPCEVAAWPQPNYIFDFGQNLVGAVRLRVSGPAGTTVRLRYAEVLEDGPNATDGPIYTANLRSARCTDFYTLRGDGLEEWTPRFTFHGFRYVEVRVFALQHPTTATDKHTQIALGQDSLTALVLHSDTPKTGDFSCSDPLLNQLQRNIDWGQRGNFLDVPTDCPQRDERLGWTGDAQVFVRTAAFNRDVAGFFRKWQQDIDEAQRDSGSVPSVVPNTDEVGGADGGPAWADAVIICPWTIYQVYGDRKILSDHYPSFARFMEFLATTARDGIRCYEGYSGWRGFGDWLNINEETPQDLIGTAYYAYDADLMARIAAVLGKEDDQRTYRLLFEQIRTAFQKRFLTDGGLVAPGSQTAHVLALHFNLVPDEMRPLVAEHLVRNIKRRGNRLTTGFVGSSYLPHALTDTGHLDTAYALLHQTRWPSWLYAVTQGATTIWERWDGWTHDKGFQDAGMNSFNHYAYGAIGSWLYQSVAGIDVDPSAPGYRKIVLRPRPGGTLTQARASLRTGYGPVESDWVKTDTGLTWSVVVPPNTTATAYVPSASGDAVTEGEQDAASAPGVTFLRRDEGQTSASVYELAPGRYRFTVAQAV